MRYISTRDKKVSLTAAEAIAMGLSRDGGLFVPEVVPALADGAIESLCGMNYQQRAVYVMKMYLDDYSVSELNDFTQRGYGPAKFDSPTVAPVYKLDGNTHFLELWHGPTCAFKDMALQMLPYFLTSALVKTGEKKQACILVATSGDTGKAALEGFKDVDRVKIMVFYPRDGVSDIQKLQMTSQSGKNVGVCSVIGNFDDAQNGVKKMFSDPDLRDELAQAGYFLSSANSINWGRLLPQIVYYISAYCDLVNAGDIKNGDKINFCVPTGNFGDILAGYYAKCMGLPVNKLICASNSNDVLTDFIKTGTYDRNRKFYTTISPSMDILLSSNLERLLFILSGGNDAETAEYMRLLSSDGKYTVSDEIKRAVSEEFACSCCDDGETRAAICRVFREHGYLMDTHTAVAYDALNKYRAETGDDTVSVVVSTASAYKFCGSVLEALGESADMDGLALIDRLEQVTGTEAPAPLKSLKNKTVRFTDFAKKDGMETVVKEFLS
ncbi:MAG: threonine synthase [Oscillospiraceae bacterium]|nr:threonine synthase [Oscillospiraceae bacterium]